MWSLCTLNRKCQNLQENISGNFSVRYLLYILTSFWVLNTPKSLSKFFFNDFPVKKLKKERKSKKIDAKFSKTHCLGCAAPKCRSKYTTEIQPFSTPYCTTLLYSVKIRMFLALREGVRVSVQSLK